MTSLLQISDPHFGTEQPEVADALIRLADALRPELVVLSGDITQRARRRQFAAAACFMERFGATPRLVIPGNHDIPLFDVFARVLHPYANYQRAFGEVLEPVYESPALLVIGVNTTRRGRHTDGEVSPAQVERVAGRLARADARQLRVVVTHQPVAAAEVSDLHNLLHGRELAVTRWAEAGADLVLGGHIHLPYVLPLATRFEIARPLFAVQAGTSLSTRVRGNVPNSVNVIRYDTHEDDTHENARRTAHVERYDFSSETRGFEVVRTHDLSLALLKETAHASGSADTTGPLARAIASSHN